MTALTMKRRDFLQVSTIGGAFILGFRIPTSRPATPAGSSVGSDINAWIRVDQDDTITMFVSESEMGQGIMTAVSMLLADEMEADWSHVRAEHALADRDKYGSQSTGGSTSIRAGYERFRQAGAAAREMMIAAAADRWGVPADDCRAEQSVVIHTPTNRGLRYGELATAAAAMPIPEHPRLKEPSEFRLIGHSTKRLDTPLKVTGRATFGIDVRIPNMVVAQVVHCPVFGGQVARFDASRAKDVPGVLDVVEIPTGVAVVAEHFWAAKKGRDVLDVTWDEGANANLSSDGITARCREIVGSGTTARTDGNAETAIANASRTLSATYHVPYLAHATMEPMNCTADVRVDRCEIWAPTQSPSGAQRTGMSITDLPADRVTVHTTFMGGGFGRRSESDFVADAVHASKAVGRPVKIIWTREDDTRGGYYRPTAYNEFVGAVDANGWPSAWVHRIASPSILMSKGYGLRDGLDAPAIEGAANIPYGFPDLHVTWADPEIPIPLHWWRSVGSSQNAYVTECFFDELCALGGVDPLEARLRMLDSHARHRGVLNVAAEHSGWGTPLPTGRARGIAVHESFGSIVAQVAEVSLRDDGLPRVHHVTCAVDCGIVVNPDTVRAQMESGIMYGLSAALYGELTIERGRVVESNFHDYPVVRMREAPTVDVQIAVHGDAPGGIGEPGTPPIAPAVVNAMRALTGEPTRQLPMRLGIGRADG